MGQTLITDQLKNLISTTTGNITLIDHETGVQLYSKTMQDIGIDVKEDNKKIQGGIGNPTIYSWGENRQIEVALDDATAKLDFTAAKFGTELQKGNVDAFKEAKTYKLTGKKVSLDVSPKAGEKLRIFNLKTGELIDSAKMQVTGKDITFTDLEDGQEVYVYGYHITTEGLYIDIDSTKFAKSFEVIITNPVVMIDANGNPSTKFIRQYIFPSGRLQGAMKDDMKAKSDGGKMNSKIEIIKPLNADVMGRIVVLPVEAFESTELKKVLSA